MSDLIYRNGSLAHASKYQVGHYDTSKYSSKAIDRGNRKKTKEIIGRKVPGRKYGNYKSPYYDPVARHERYMNERDKLGIGKGTASLSSAGGKGGSGGKGSSGKGKGGKGGSGGKGSSGKGGVANTMKELSDAIAKLKEDSSMNTSVQQEVVRRKMSDLQADLRERIQALRDADTEKEGVNIAEMRGRIQETRAAMQKTGDDFQGWLTNERSSLERKIAELHKAKGVSYNENAEQDKKNAQEARDKEVKSRADSIYKKRH